MEIWKKLNSKPTHKDIVAGGISPREIAYGTISWGKPPARHIVLTSDFARPAIAMAKRVKGILCEGKIFR